MVDATHANAKATVILVLEKGISRTGQPGTAVLATTKAAFHAAFHVDKPRTDWQTYKKLMEFSFQRAVDPLSVSLA